jgi:hypothetical protein
MNRRLRPASSRPARAAALAACLALASLAVVPARDVSAQDLPVIPPPGGCRSELDARLAFGLCRDSTFDFYASGEYRQGIPRPEEVLGYPIGSWHTTYGRMEKYIAALAEAAPERVRVFDYGRSVEGQVMHLIAVSAERHIGRLEQIRAGLARLADPRATTRAEAEALIQDLPVVVWLNAANDGNETAAFEAAIQLAYQLAAGEDARTRAMCGDALVLINLAHNPESHERMVAWYNAFVMGDPDPAALEHRAPWGMSTNNNHYQFDLNRDALGLTQTETRAVAAELQRWRPQVFVDLHGQTTQFFFPPNADPVSPVYPEQMVVWLERFGQGNAAAFDEHGWSYYTRDVFDLYYPGYWDTYPGLHGATGMTYETDGGGSKGVRWRRDDGTILRFADGIARHFVASLATVETAARHRAERLRDYHAFFVAGMEKGRTGGVRTVVFFSEDDEGRAARLATTLLRHGVEVQRVTREGSAALTDYLGGARRTIRVPAGAYVVDLAQPNGILAHTLLAPEIRLPAGFAAQELARFARNARRAPGERERHAFYDVTAWSLPLALAVPAAWSDQPVSLATEPVRLPAEAAKASGGWAGERAITVEGGTSGRARSSYVWRPGSVGAYRLVARLMGEGFNVAVAERELVVDGQDFPRGTFIARVDRNPESLHERIAALAREAGVRVTAAASAFPDRGPTGTGSETTRTLAPPRIAVLAGEGVRITSYGALWFQLEQRIGQPFTALRADGAADELDRFDVIILPEGNYGRSLDASGWRALRDRVERGATLIAYGAAARWVMEQDTALYERPDTSALPRDTVEAILRRIDAAAPTGNELPPKPSPRARPDAPVPVPGTFLRGRLDREHWLTFGHTRAELPLHARSVPLRASLRGANPVVYAEDAERLVISGFSWPDNTVRTYAGAPYATVDRVGSGKIILFAEDPLFRGVWDGPGLLLMNAIYLGAPARPGAE